MLFGWFYEYFENPKYVLTIVRKCDIMIPPNDIIQKFIGKVNSISKKLFYNIKKRGMDGCVGFANG
jgi:hypothetical protein